MVKLNELRFDLLPHPPYSPDLFPSDYWLFADLRKMLQGKRFGSNEKVIAETEAYFGSKDESSYKKGIEKLEKRCNECITLEGNYEVCPESIRPDFISPRWRYSSSSGGWHPSK